MAPKPAKFGIKFWFIVDAKSKYQCNGKPYLGKDPTCNSVNDPPVDECMWLMNLYLKKVT